MDVRRLESLLLQEHVVKAGQEHAGYGDNGTFVSAAFFDPVILEPEIRIALVFDGSKRTLNQQGLKVSASPENTAALLLAGALVILRGKPGPGAEMLSRLEDRHVRADLGNDITGGSLCDARDVGGQLDQFIIGFGEVCDGIVQPANDGRKVIGMLPAELHLDGLVIGNFITNDGGDHITGFILSPLKEQLFAVTGVELLAG